MLSHRQAQELIDRALDTPVPYFQHEQLNTHLAECAACRAYATRLLEQDQAWVEALARRWPQAVTRTGQQQDLIRRMEKAYHRGRNQHTLRLALRWGAGVMAAILVLSVALWLMLPPFPTEPAVEETPTLVAQEPVTAAATPTNSYITLHYQFKGNPGLGNVRLYHANCDGVIYYPQPGEQRNKSQTPRCELISSNILLVKPGQPRQILLVYDNPTPSDIEVTFLPEQADQHLWLNGLCQSEGAGITCASFTVDEENVWATYLTIAVPATWPVGSYVDINVQVVQTALSFTLP
ncbi:MAG: hypothetical protein KA314_13840 [Chloroflexi bacterium]|nr:hypothetical protein [Chloroflexota bacterium]MBP8056915.1 hypothetical protein [Chloroflexota bacterium]